MRREFCRPDKILIQPPFRLSVPRTVNKAIVEEQQIFPVVSSARNAIMNEASVADQQEDLENDAKVTDSLATVTKTSTTYTNIFHHPNDESPD